MIGICSSRHSFLIKVVCSMINYIQAECGRGRERVVVRVRCERVVSVSCFHVRNFILARGQGESDTIKTRR